MASTDGLMFTTSTTSDFENLFLSLSFIPERNGSNVEVFTDVYKKKEF